MLYFFFSSILRFLVQVATVLCWFRVCRKLCEWQMTKQKPVVVSAAAVMLIKILAVLVFFFFFCSVLAFYTGCNQLQLANWLTNLAYCTSFVLLFAFAGLESVWWLATNCTLIDSSSFDSFSLSLAHISMVSMLPPQKEADRQSLHSTANDFGSSAGPR